MRAWAVDMDTDTDMDMHVGPPASVLGSATIC